MASRDVEDVISKISSEKVKTREEGIRLLSCLLDGERSIAFCSLLSRNTARLEPDEIPHDKTWPFLVKMLTTCISSDVSASKKRPPKLLFAKTLRTVIQRVEDAKFSGNKMLLLPVIKLLFNHIWEVICDLPSFQSEYGIILRQLLAVKEYRFHMRKKIYCSLVILYLSKIETTFCEKDSAQSKEETFRSILTLQSLLESPPGDFPDNIRDDVVKGFIAIFSHVRDEGKISRKLLESINIFLTQNGPNLGFQLQELHHALQKFVFRFWLTTHDHAFKSTLILYARIQVKLSRSSTDMAPLLEQLLDVVCKELDYNSASVGGTLWDDKVGIQAKTEQGLMELAASVLYQACANVSKAPSTDKRVKREQTAACIKEALKQGKWLWYGALYFLIQNHHSRISDALLVDWFQGIYENLDRILSDGNKLHAYYGVVWVLRSLQVLAFVLSPLSTRADVFRYPSSISHEVEGGWHKIWSCLMHWLPIFSNVTSVADAALMLLGSIILNELVTMLVVPQDIWDLQIFRHAPSMSALYFICCYFSRKDCQGGMRDVLHQRQHLLKTICGSLYMKELSLLDDRNVMLLPAALFSLSASYACFPHRFICSYISHLNIPQAESWTGGVESKRKPADELFECSVEVVAEIELRTRVKACPRIFCHNLHFPRQLMHPLMHELEDHILVLVNSNRDIQKMSLPDIFKFCALLSNCIYHSTMVRKREGKSNFVYEMIQHLLWLLEQAASIIQENQILLQLHGSLGSSNILDSVVPALVSVRSFTCSPLFSLFHNDNSSYSEFLKCVIPVIERLLMALAKLYVEVSNSARKLELEEAFRPSSPGAQDSPLMNDVDLRIVDIDLDMNINSRDAGVNVAGKSGISRMSLFSELKLDIISAISSFFSILPNITWNGLFDLMVEEQDFEVCECILRNLCENFTCSSSRGLSDLVDLMNKMVQMSISLRRRCVTLLTSIRHLLGNLLSSSPCGNNDTVMQPVERMQNLSLVADFLNKVPVIMLLDWAARVELIDCICCFVTLDPCLAQGMIERLLEMLQDKDYRVRLFLARRISVLFQTWAGHQELFQDICSSFGAKIAMVFKEKLVTAEEVLAAGDQPLTTMETALVTLAHLAFCSAEVELEAVFMMCTIAAINPCLRELTYAAFDNLAKQLQYADRAKYLVELLGSILMCWVTCGVSLVSLLGIRELFVPKSELSSFMQYISPWVIPPLILYGKTSELNWVSTVTSQSVATLVKNFFVPIFATCMALHCSKKPNRENGAAVLSSSILQIAEISENERDSLIKKNMVSIVSCLLSLASSDSDPTVPCFPVDTIADAIKTVVDGFLEMDVHSLGPAVVDKIQIFRSDRVFKFLLEIHRQITSAAHPRQRRHRLSAVEVLISLLGPRALVPSSACYLFNLLGQHVGSKALQDQCCRILSTLLEGFKNKPSKDVAVVLGEQLQFLVSKLVACCIPSNETDASSVDLSTVISLLHQLTVDAHPYLYDYIRELEPFPELDCLQNVQSFYCKLCNDFSSREQFLKFVQRAPQLPHKILIWRLETLHRKLLEGEIVQLEKTKGEFNSWYCDSDIVSAVWKLVGMSGSTDAKDTRQFVADFISRVGIGDPHGVIFHLPYGCNQKACPPLHSCETGVSDELLINLIRLLKKYLMDDSVTVIEVASGALRGLLSTERGQQALLSFDSFERALLEVHSNGVNLDLVEKLMLDAKRKADAEAVSLEDPFLWRTAGKTYDKWLCPLAYSLIIHTNDVTLRLCADVVLLKSEMAELLFPVILMNLAGRKDLASDLCLMISSQVQENIFVESNQMIQSIQLILDALNVLRVYGVTEGVCISSTASKRANVKSNRNSSSRHRSNRFKGSSFSSSEVTASEEVFEKVYWLSIDYLVVANSAVRCGCYFTAIIYVEHWCEEHFNGLALGSLDFSHLERLPPHIELMVAALTQINEPDSLYGIVRSHKLRSQVITFEHEGNWSKALECYDLLVRTEADQVGDPLGSSSRVHSEEGRELVSVKLENAKGDWKFYKGLMRSLQQTGCTHILDVYCQGLTTQRSQHQQDSEFNELQYEVAWRAGNWDFSLLSADANSPHLVQENKSVHFNKTLHSCLRALQEGEPNEFHMKLKNMKQELVWLISNTSKESTEDIHLSVVRLQILDHVGMAWDLRWKSKTSQEVKVDGAFQKIFSEPVVPRMSQLDCLNTHWTSILKRTRLHFNLVEPFIAFRRVLLQILNCKDSIMQHLLQSASSLRKGSRFSLAAAFLHELKLLSAGTETEQAMSYVFSLGKLEESKLLWAQGQHEMAINLARYIIHHYELKDEASNAYSMVGNWLAETRSSNSRSILEQYLKYAVELSESIKNTDKKSITKKCQSYFHLAHYTDALFRSYAERLSSSEWQAALRLRIHKSKELDALIKRLKSSTKSEKTDYSAKIMELQKQLAMDKEEAQRLEDDRDNFLDLALEGYQHCLVAGDKYDLQVVFRLVSLWFSLSSRLKVVDHMLNAIKEVQSFKFIPLVYQIASRMGGLKDGQGSQRFHFALISLVKKMAIDHPYHTMFQLLALGNGDRIRDKQRSRNSFIVDMDKKLAAENLLNELSSYHGARIRQMKQLVEIYIKIAEFETKREDTNRRIALPREIRSTQQLELVPVVTATIAVDRSCQYPEGSFPHFRGLADSLQVMNGINAPKVVECIGSDGRKYRQLAKSGNDDLRQDAVMEQFFDLVNTFLQNHQDTLRRRLTIRTYKVVPFTPSAGVLEWVDRTIPLGEYLLGSQRNGGAHGRYGIGDWPFSQCREYLTNEKDKRKAYQKVCENFRPVMHFFFLERYLQPANWFEKRLSYTRSVAASSMVGYIVGLGDRHSNNILIDEATAEVVHIDLGVAFDQGLMLKTPERVPFRLTRDMIDGMGVTGVEGVFRRCCEETLSVMRTNKEALLTIIEVFIHDPLYKWALSPLKALQRQKETADDIESGFEDSQDVHEGNKDAARALIRVKQKLDGYEEGELRSVKGQVQQLIQNAVDTERLCQMYPGWGAWL